MKPLSQYDAVADPVLDWDRAPANSDVYEAKLPAEKLIAELNPTVAELPAGDPRRKLAQRSEKMDFIHDDAAPAREVNEIVWQTVKGTGSRMPEPRGSALGKDDDDDD